MIYWYVDSYCLDANANGDLVVVGSNADTLGLKSIISDAANPLGRLGRSLLYLSSEYEFTVKKSPLSPGLIL